MVEDREVEGAPASDLPDDDRSEWFPVFAGLAGLVGGAVIGGALGLSNGTRNALQLAVVGAFLGMVMVLVPVTSRRRFAEDDDRPAQESDQPIATPLEVISSLRRAKKRHASGGHLVAASDQETVSCDDARRWFGVSTGPEPQLRADRPD